MEESKLTEIINEELNSYEKLLLSSVKEGCEITYINHIAEKYDQDADEVLNRSLDLFNYYMKNNVDEYQSKVMSLYKTHEQILRKCLK